MEWSTMYASGRGTFSIIFFPQRLNNLSNYWLYLSQSNGIVIVEIAVSGQSMPGYYEKYIQILNDL